MELLRTGVGTILSLDAEYDISLTGFAADDLNLSFDTADSEGASADPPVPSIEQKPVTQLGGVWLIGDHRLVCSDATSVASYTHCSAASAQPWSSRILPST